MPSPVGGAVAAPVGEPGRRRARIPCGQGVTEGPIVRAFSRILLPLAVPAVLLAGCAGGDGGDGDDAGSGEAAVTFVAVDIDFAEAPASAPAGDVTVELVNEGDQQHNVTFEGVGDGPAVEAQGGETATGSVTLEPGEYVAFCSVPGHREAGMETTVTAEQ